MRFFKWKKISFYFLSAKLILLLQNFSYKKDMHQTAASRHIFVHHISRLLFLTLLDNSFPYFRVLGCLLHLAPQVYL